MTSDKIVILIIGHDCLTHYLTKIFLDWSELKQVADEKHLN